MRKFTKAKKANEEKNKDKILYEDDIRKVISYKDDWTLVQEKDFIVVIPYLIETNQIILRHEFIPTFEWNEGRESAITVVSGGIENGEKIEDALAREVEEECGLIISPDVNIEIFPPLYMSKGTSSRYYTCILPLSENSYQETFARGDGSKIEKMSKSFKLDIKKLSSVTPVDLITAYMLEKFKRYINL